MRKIGCFVVAQMLVLAWGVGAGAASAAAAIVPDGTLDTSFGNGGRVTTDLTSSPPFEPGGLDGVL
ncbi:MAG: hypothetical protein WBM00_03175 [Solirubrobacterales bacterium]